MQRILAAVAAFFLISTAHAQTWGKRVTIPTAGPWAEIDVDRTNTAIRALSLDKPKQRERAMNGVLSNPSQYAPPALCHLSAALFKGGRKDEGSFWFYACQLRARTDANLCTDRSAAEGVMALNYQFGEQINKYMYTQQDVWEAMMPTVMEWDINTPHDYDRRWISLHGLNATLYAQGNTAIGELPLILPEDQWADTDAETRRVYREGFIGMFKMFKEQQTAE